MDALLKVKDLHVSYGKFKVIQDLTFDAIRGQILGIIGPNGAGKTTLMNALIGLVIPTSGHIFFDGQEITKMLASKRCNLGLGRTYQVPRPFEGMTVFENLLVGAVHGAHKSEKASLEICSEALHMTNLYDKRNILTTHLALLDRKRLEIARALATEPRLMLLDEVSAGLTEAEVVDVIELVTNLKAMGITIIWIEHVIKTMSEATDSLICLSNGTKLVEGDPCEVMNSKEVEEVYLGVDEDNVCHAKS